MLRLLRQSAQLLALARPANSFLPVLLVCFGGLLVGADGAKIAFAVAICFIAHSVATIANDLEDAAIDVDNDQDLRVLDIPTPRSVWWILVVLSILSLAFSWLFISQLVTLFLLAIYVISWVYNSRPLQLSRHPVASIVALGLVYGLLPFLLGVGLGEISWSLVAIGLGFAISRASLSVLKDYKDVYGDAKHQKKTFLLIYGRSRVFQVSVAAAIIGYVTSVVASYMVLGHEYLWPVLLTIAATTLVCYRLRFTADKSYTELNRLFHRALRLEVVLYGGFLLWATI